MALIFFGKFPQMVFTIFVVETQCCDLKRTILVLLEN